MTRYCHDDYEHTDMCKRVFFLMTMHSEFIASFRILTRQRCRRHTKQHHCTAACQTFALVVKSFSFRNTFKPVNWQDEERPGRRNMGRKKQNRREEDMQKCVGQHALPFLDQRVVFQEYINNTAVKAHPGEWVQAEPIKLI